MAVHTRPGPAFQVNDYIFHGGSGVCKVLDICVPDARRTDPTRTYYRLLPLYEQGSVIYTPTDNSKSIVRKILTREEADQLIAKIRELDTIWIDNEKTREEVYREALRTNECLQWMRVIKTLYERGQARRRDGKRITQTDEKYLRMAEDLLFGELAVSLGRPKEQMAEYITQQVLHAESREARCS